MLARHRIHNLEELQNIEHTVSAADYDIITYNALLDDKVLTYFKAPRKSNFQPFHGVQSLGYLESHDEFCDFYNNFVVNNTLLLESLTELNEEAITKVLASQQNKNTDHIAQLQRLSFELLLVDKKLKETDLAEALLAVAAPQMESITAGFKEFVELQLKPETLSNHQANVQQIFNNLT